MSKGLRWQSGRFGLPSDESNIIRSNPVLHRAHAGYPHEFYPHSSAEGRAILITCRRTGDFCCVCAEHVGKLIAWIALFVSSAFSQTSAVPPAASEVATQQVQVGNPFASPWRLDQRSDAAAMAVSIPEAAITTTKISKRVA